MSAGRRSRRSRRARRPLLFLVAVAAQVFAGPPPRGESWLAVLASRSSAGGAPLTLAVPIGLGRAPALFGRLPGPARPVAELAPWLSYGLFGLPGTMPLALRPVWQSALGWRSPLARRWTSARAALAPLLGSSLAETWRAVESAHSDPEVAAMTALLDRSLVVDGELINEQAAPAGPQDVRRARRIAWAIAAAAATVALIFATRLLRRVGLRL